jgi:CheY-like chemotaxis protein
MTEKPASRARINLKEAVILLLDPNVQGMEVLCQILLGFGSKKIFKANDYESARELAETHTLDLIICEGANAASEKDGYDFVYWLRQSELETNAYTPVIIASAHTGLSCVKRGRDCGANFFVMKPLSPAVLLDRIVWVAQERRPFIRCPVYIGPDRRFKNLGPPLGENGRRSNDLSAEVGAAVAPNMSQEEIDSLMQPKRASA